MDAEDFENASGSDLEGFSDPELESYILGSYMDHVEGKQEWSVEEQQSIPLEEQPVMQQGAEMGQSGDRGDEQPGVEPVQPGLEPDRQPGLEQGVQMEESDGQMEESDGQDDEPMEESDDQEGEQSQKGGRGRKPGRWKIKGPDGLPNGFFGPWRHQPVSGVATLKGPGAKLMQGIVKACRKSVQDRNLVSFTREELRAFLASMKAMEFDAKVYIAVVRRLMTAVMRYIASVYSGMVAAGVVDKKFINFWHNARNNLSTHERRWNSQPKTMTRWFDELYTPVSAYAHQRR